MNLGKGSYVCYLWSYIHYFHQTCWMLFSFFFVSTKSSIRQRNQGNWLGKRHMMSGKGKFCAVKPRCKKYLKLQIHLHLAFFSDDLLHKSFLNQITLNLRKWKWTFLNWEFTVILLWDQLLCLLIQNLHLRRVGWNLSTFLSSQTF